MRPVAARLKGIGGSPTVRLGALVNDMKRRGEDLVSFSVGEPDFPTPPHVIDAAKKALDEGWTKYGPSLGLPQLREAIAEKMKRENAVPATPDGILVAPTKHALYIAITGLVDPGDEVLFPDPGWVSYGPMVHLAGGRPVPVLADESTGYELTPESLEAAITLRAKAVVINSPSNPAGSVFSKETMKGICDVVADRDLFLISDEIYEKILYDGTHYSPASFDGMADRTVTVHGFSKTYAMTGWRLGWLCAEASLVKQLVKIQESTITCAPAFVQWAGLAALKGPPSAVQAMVDEFRARRDLMMAEFASVDGFRVSRPAGAFYFFPRFELDVASDEFAERLLTEARVAVTPGSAFGAAGEHHLRFSYACSREDIKKGMERLRSFLEKMDK
ncbi:MAG TPA: pyridoxal phosphate-dependent aminotransferase [Thermoplasmata archaeon]|nr:pyridoxal phosphate-dependent aminotransferase [Thermoplasmata archaeon]